MRTYKSVLQCILALMCFNAVADNQVENKLVIKQAVINEALTYELDPALALAIVSVESNFNPQAVSHAGARGLMQIMPKTAQEVFNVPSYLLFDESVNINLGVRFISQLLQKYDNRVEIALSHYNGGSAVNLGNGHYQIIPATQAYVDKVLAKRQDFLPFVNQYVKNETVNPLIFASNINRGVPTSKLVKLQNIQVHNATRKANQEGLKILGPKIVSEPNVDEPSLLAIETLEQSEIPSKYLSNSEKNKLKTRHFRGAEKHVQSIPEPLLAKRNKVMEWESIYAK